ncbi:hypothetical protein GCM10010406_52880 [Streptomyces thermolineatus]|uniref:Uncharacterized protein n=1 Tax=Streptomyces thermolineatus TaxID=44033 RepID=A0ABP6A367_9ACTN
MPSPRKKLPPDAATLAKRIAALEEQLKELRAAKRLSHAAITNGRLTVVDAAGQEVWQLGLRDDGTYGASLTGTALEVYDSGGSLRAIVGEQPDGSAGVTVTNGPTPPTPTDPVVEPALAALAVTWDGAFTDAEVAPLDWSRVEVHIGPAEDFEAGQDTLRATIETPQGGTATISLPYTQHWVRLRSRSTAGTPGPVTAAVAGTPRQAGAGDITADAINGRVITGATVQTAETGARIVLGGNRLDIYDSLGELIASIPPDGSSYGGGFWTRGFQFPNSIYSMLAGGELHFNTTDRLASSDGVAQWTYYPTNRQTALYLASGAPISSYRPAWLELLSQADDRARPTARITDGSTGACDLSVSGDVTVSGRATVNGPISSDNIRAQRSQTPAPGTGGGTTTVDVVFSNPMSGTPRVVISPDTSVDPAAVQVRGYVDNISASGFTIRCYRSTNSATNWNWVAISD